MALDAVGLTLGLIPEIRNIITTLKTRINNYRQGPSTFSNLQTRLDSMTDDMEKVESIMKTNTNAIPQETLSLFHRRIEAVKQHLQRTDSVVEELSASTFPSTTPRTSLRIRAFFQRAARADSISAAMASLETSASEASTTLQGLVLELSLCVKFDGMSASSRSTPFPVGSEYAPEGSTPALSHTVSLDFNVKDSRGMPVTPEGCLKNAVLSSDSSNAITAATGVLVPAYGVVGMAGVGKTIAIQGLAYDAEIQQRFHDGIHYISLGQGVSLRTVVREVAHIMRTTGADNVVAVENSTTLKEAVDYAVKWFRGKTCLFLVDDLWPTQNSKTGYLNGLRQLLRGSPRSRMAVTTRSVAVAHSAGSIVDFGARDSLGFVSVNIFMAHATGSATAGAATAQTSDLRESVRRILLICAGLPIALSITGCAVAMLTREYSNFDSACDAYVIELETQKTLLGDEESLEGKSLSAGIFLSLKILETEYLKLKSSCSVVTEYTITDLYTSFCVLRNQAWVPISVLCRIWQIDHDSTLAIVRLMCGLSLSELQFRRRSDESTTEPGVMLHDLQLLFCQRQSEKMKTSTKWHTSLLDGYLKSSPAGGLNLVSADSDLNIETTILTFNPRHWWSVPVDGYIHGNLARHLAASDLEMELAALLLDARWTHCRISVGGILALRDDFEGMKSQSSTFCSPGSSDAPKKDMKTGFEMILKALDMSWGRIAEGLRPLLFQMCGRLLKMRKDSAIVDTYLRSLETHTPRPYLAPMTPMFPDIRCSQTLEVPVGGQSCALACSPCGSYIAAGAACGVVIIDAITGDLVHRAKGRVSSEATIALSFGRTSTQVVSASVHTLTYLDWDSSKCRFRSMRGHSKAVTAIAFNNYGDTVLTGSRDCNLRIICTQKGSPIRAFPQPSSVECLAVFPDEQKTAIGLENGTLKVLDYDTGATVFEDRDAHREKIRTVTLNANCNRLATGSDDKTILMWDTTSWTRMGKAFEGHEKSIVCIALSPTGEYVASGSADRTLRLWAADTASTLWACSNILSSPVQCVTFTHDGERVIFGFRDGILRIRDATTEMEEIEQEYGHSAPVLGVAISTDGLRVASASQDGTLKLWDARRGMQIGPPLEGHEGAVQCLKFSPDGSQIASGSSDTTARIWDTETFYQIADPLQGHVKTVSSVAFSLDGLRVVSASWDKTVIIWDIRSGQKIGTVLEKHQQRLRAIAVSSVGSYIVCRDLNRKIIIWDCERRRIVWDSKLGSPLPHGITNKVAENVIRGCGDFASSSRLWPACFPPYDSELYSEGSTYYSNVEGMKNLLGTFPSSVRHRQYSEEHRLLAAGLHNGAVAICILKVS